MTTSSRILIVDDNLTNRKLLLGSLRKIGYETLEAKNGYEAVDLVRERNPDIVLLDVMMPGRDGFEVCQILKTSEATSDIPVIFITAKSDPEDIAKAFSAGGADYVTKPFHLSEVKARVSLHLGLRQAAEELADKHAQLLHAQKLESIGQLAAGIAHEINTPTQYVGDNLRFLEIAFNKLMPLVEQARELAAAIEMSNDPSAAGSALIEDLRRARVDFLAREIPSAIEQSLGGVDRVARIVRAMKEFSHPGGREMTLLDLNRAIESTITIATNEWKYAAEMKTDFDADLPPVPCLPGELNQVILNLIVNAAHAIIDVVGDGADGKGTIKISTRRDHSHAEIRIADTGTGIPEGIRDRIFDPFFTTKEVGKGSGQGLSIAHGVIVQEHGGELLFETELGRGTTFVIRLPLERETAASGAVA